MDKEQIGRIVAAVKNEIGNEKVPDKGIRRSFLGLSYVKGLSDEDLKGIRGSIKEHRPELIDMAQADPRLLSTN